MYAAPRSDKAGSWQTASLIGFGTKGHVPAACPMVGRTQGFRVTDGAAGRSADLQEHWSCLPTALIPKLIVRFRFSSPAPRPKAQRGKGTPAQQLPQSALGRSMPQIWSRPECTGS
jgi:hypothetical protein